VLSVKEHRDGFGFVDVTGAVGDLREIYKLKVIVEASPDSIPDQLLTTTRQNILNIPPMDRAMIEILPQLEPLLNVLKKEEDLLNVAWEVLSGIPSEWEGLLEATTCAVSKEGKKETVGIFLRDKIMEAIRTRTSYLQAHPHIEPVLEANVKSPDVWITDEMERELLNVSQKNRPSPDKVFSIEERNDVIVVVPASSAMRIVIKHNLKSRPTLEELQKICGGSC
jgi:propanediol dehydratase small subunit